MNQSHSCITLNNMKRSKLFDFIHSNGFSTNNGTPVLDKKDQKEYFVLTVNPNTQIARDLYQASNMARQLGTISDDLIKKRYVKLSKCQFDKIVVLDLDETLIYATASEIKIRPYCNEFLQSMSKQAQLVLFTSATNCYAKQMLRLIDPNNKYFSAVCSKEQCIGTIKDLRIFNKDLKNIVIVDNTPQNFIAQINNGIPIIPFLGSEDDDELLQLQGFLEKLILEVDMREKIADTFQIDQYYKFINGKYAINELYGKQF